MKKTNLIKIVSVLLITLIVGMYVSNVYATTEGEDIFDSLQGSMNESDTSKKEETKKEETPKVEQPKKEENTSIYNNTTTNNEKEALPKTGLEDTIPMIGLISVAGISAIFAFKKVREYSNI